MTKNELGKRLLALLGLLAIVGFVAFCLQNSQAPSLPPSVALADPPEIPASVLDHEVRTALTEARDKVIADPRSPKAWSRLGFVFRSHFLYPQSTDCWTEASKLEPTNARWPYLIGLNTLRFSVTEAIPHLRNALTLASGAEEQSVARLQLAEALLKQNELEEAANLFLNCLANDSRNPRAHFGLGVIAVNRGDYSLAVQHLLLAAANPHSCQKAGSLLASCYYQLGKTKDAESLERALLHVAEDSPWPDPFDPGLFSQIRGLSVHQKEAIKLEAEGRYNESLAALQEIAQHYPDEVVEARMGFSLVNKRDFAGAEKTMRDALAKDPSNATSHYYLGIAFYGQAEEKWQRGDREAAKELFLQALVEFRKAIELKPDMGLAHDQMVFTLKYLGKLPEALEAARAAIAARPQASITHLSMAEVLIAMGKTEEAIPHLETAVKLAQAGDNRAKTILSGIRK